MAKVCRSVEALPVERHQISVNDKGRYDLVLDREFPFVIKLFHFSSRHYTPALSWHERLELFMPLDGTALFRMGNQVFRLEAGDLLVVDNMKLHALVDFPEFNTRALVISFLPRLVYSFGSPSYDYALLTPFYCNSEKHAHVLRARERAAEPVHKVLADLIDCYFRRSGQPAWQAGCKAFLLAALYHLASRFNVCESLRAEFIHQQERSSRFKALFDFVSEHFSGRITIDRAAALVHMSRSRFMGEFKKVAGMTFVAYLNHVRLSRAYQMLKESRASIAEIAAGTGFSDQSYFDRQFKKAFGRSPRQLRTPPQATRGENLSL